MPSRFHSRLALLFVGFGLCFVSGTPAELPVFHELRPIVKADGYKHDRFGTLPRDHFREFRAYVTSFDTKDDNDGDGVEGKEDRWAIPEWVSYELRRGTPGSQFEPRPSPWMHDAGLFASEEGPKDNSYKNSGYDRGHLCMRQHARLLGQDADWNTHTVLNAMPQRHQVNAGAWLHLENLTLKWAFKYQKVWIICGPVIYGGKPSKWIGDDGEIPVAVPDAFFKIVVKENDDDELDVLAFIFPQHGKGNYGGSKKSVLEPHLTSVDIIEALTGLDFFTTLDDDDEAIVERTIAVELWEE